jgi:hypothetical protein
MEMHTKYQRGEEILYNIQILYKLNGKYQPKELTLLLQEQHWQCD